MAAKPPRRRRRRRAGPLSRAAWAATLPTIDVPRAELDKGVPAYALFQRAGLAASNGEARRLIKGGGARVNDAPVSDEAMPVTSAMLSAEGAIKLSAGKKKHALVRAV